MQTLIQNTPSLLAEITDGATIIHEMQLNGRTLVVIRRAKPVINRGGVPMHYAAYENSPSDSDRLYLADNYGNLTNEQVIRKSIENLTF
jgi:hypothetical protein